MVTKLLSVVGLAVLGAASAAAEVEGHWEGRIEIPGAPLDVKVDLARDGEAWRGTIDIPAQGAQGLPLFRIQVRGEGEQRVEFVIRGVPGAPTFKGRLAGGEISGRFEQGGASFPFRLGRETVVRRPQVPQPPFPYTEEEVRLESGPLQLVGTLTLPDGKGPFPAALLISGSGPQDRDHTLFGHKPFWVLADHLSRAGIAVLRVDDAGAGDSTPHPAPPTIREFAADAGAAVDFLRSDPRIRSVGLIGHSEGGLIAPMLASSRDDLAFIVLLAAPGVPGDQLMRRQNERIYAAAGVSDEHRRVLLGLIDRLFAVLMSGAPAADALPQVEQIVREQMVANGVPVAQQLTDRVRAAAAQALAAGMRHFLRYDPRPALTRTRVPVLALNGELDVQVDAAQNIPAIQAALAEAGNANVEVQRLAGLNHLFQTATTGLPNEYGVIEETMAPTVLDLIRDWIVECTAEPLH